MGFSVRGFTSSGFGVLAAFKIRGLRGFIRSPPAFTGTLY